MVPSCGGEHDSRDEIRLFKDKMREDAMELEDFLASVHAPTQQDLKIAERASVYKLGDIVNVDRIDERDENITTGKRIIAMLANIVQVYLG